MTSWMNFSIFLGALHVSGYNLQQSNIAMEKPPFADISNHGFPELFLCLYMFIYDICLYWGISWYIMVYPIKSSPRF